MRARRQHHLLTIAATSVVFGYVAAGGQAHAQSAEAEGLFNDGNKLMAEGKLAAACDAFEASNRIEPRAGTLIRLGECREQNHQLASAWSAYKDALTRAKDPRKRAYATDRAAALEPRISHLTVSVPARIRVDGLTLTRNGKPLDPMLWNRALALDGGDYLITARAAGREEWHTTAHVAAEGARVTIDIPRLKEPSMPASPPAPVAAVPTPAPVAAAPVAAAPVAAAPVAAAPAVPPPAAAASRAIAKQAAGDVPPRTSSLPPRRKLAIAAAGVGMAALITGAILGASAKGKQEDALRLCPEPAAPCADADQASALLTASHSRALEANIAFGFAAAAAIGAGALWLTGAPDTTSSMRVGVFPSAAPGASLVFEGRF